MSFDGLIVGYGLSVVVGTLFGLVEVGYAIVAAVVGFDLILLRRYFKQKRADSAKLSGGVSESPAHEPPPVIRAMPSSPATPSPQPEKP